MKWLSMLVVGVVGFGAMACGPTALSCPDPAAGEVDEACGVWVSASLGNDDNPGTRAEPKASLAAAAARAFDQEQDVYACGELWTEPLFLPLNVSLYGGFDCANGWIYSGESHRARLETGPGEIPLKALGAGGERVIADFNIQAAGATEPGGSSIAVIIPDPTVLRFRRSMIVAGNAVDGLDGEEMEEPALSGAAGKAGADACGTLDGPGGAATEAACGADETSKGGKGGDGGAMLATGGEAGLPVPPGPKEPSNLQDGDGGKGEAGAEACTAGEPGANGVAGASGLGTKGDRGHISADGYTGTNGEDGKPGALAQGGGGGGASRGGAAVCGAATPGGAGGGSGGAGGCGGKAGKGGQAGGSSFAVVIFRSTDDVSFESCEIWVGQAGNGGRGAPGQPGGLGGEPGQGGTGQPMLQAGCQGGKGGVGGKGGGGAGGNGGHSVHLGYFGGALQGPWPDTTFHGKELGGDAGFGGDPSTDSRGEYGHGNNPATGIISYGFQQ